MSTAMPPVFVVGVSRSGTTLLASMLGAHSHISCGPETFFFPRLERQALDVLLAPERWPEPAVDFLSAMKLGQGPARIHELFGRTPDQLRADLRDRAPSVNAMLEALTAASARASGKPRWAEKTPNHLLYLADIRRAYPEAYILRIVRDPRDVATSLTRVPFGSTSKLANLYLWLERDERSWRFFAADRLSKTIRYEDLLADPQGTLTSVCEWMGETFEPGMLAANHDAPRMMASEEWWKQQVLAPLDRTRTAEWRTRLSEGEIRVADLACRDALERYGYPHSGRQVRRCFAKPLTRRAIERHEAVLYRAAEHDVAVLPWTWDPTNHLDAPDSGTLALWGTPGAVTWRLGKTAGERLTNATRLLRDLYGRRFSGAPVYWLDEPGDNGEPPGFLDRVCDTLARPAAPRVSAARLFGTLVGDGATPPREMARAGEAPVGPRA